MKRLLPLIVVIGQLFFALPALAQKFGAIAFDNQTYAYGVSWDQGSQQGADSSALSQCATIGQGCSVTVRFINTCGAYATGRWQTSGWGTGATREVAEQSAKFYCNRQADGAGCRVRVWGCNTRSSGSQYNGSGETSATTSESRDNARSRAEDARWWGGQEQYDRICRESDNGC